MICRGKIHAICCTGANLEEGVFNLVAHDHYARIPRNRDLTTADEENLLACQLNRVTDTCVLEEEAMRRIERVILDLWQVADREGQRRLPLEFSYQALREGLLEKHYQIAHVIRG